MLSLSQGLEWEGSGRKTGDFGGWGGYLKTSTTSVCQGKMATGRAAHIHCYNSLELRNGLFHFVHGGLRSYSWAARIASTPSDTIESREFPLKCSQSLPFT